MRRILVPTDLSPLSSYALKAAARLAKHTGGTVYGLNVVPVPGGMAVNTEGVPVDDGTMDVMPYLKAGERSTKALEQWAAQVDVPVVTRLRYGGIADAILETVSELSIDLLVVGTKGGDSIRDRLVGLLVEHLIGRADIPVLSLKAEHTGQSVHRIIFANAFTRDHQYFDILRDFHDLAGSTVELLRVNIPKDTLPVEEVRAHMDRFAAENHLHRYSKHVVKAPSVEEGVLQWTELHGGDLLAMRTHGRSGFSRLIKGCVSLDLVKSLKIPILTIRVK
ncbi:MAG: universal stress protein [Flavobacteriales bacterium]|jgi:nucleotide-binding universal stress UspA family protein